MFSKLTTVAVSLLALTIFVVVGCSDDETTPTGTNPTNDSGTVEFTEFGNLVAQIAPPVYTTPSGAPHGDWDSLWTNGTNPLLGKVFGADEPMSLYWNIENLDGAIEELTMISLRLDSMGITGDTTFTVPEGPTIELQTLIANTAIPTQCQPILGFTEVNLEKLVKLHFAEGDFSGDYHIGYVLGDSTQSYVTFFTATEGTLVESFLYYAFVNLNDSSVDIRGVFFKDYGNQTSARWGYNIETINEVDFSYRMSWFSDESPDFSLLGCVVGGGNKDEMFALKYRQYVPADTTVIDSAYILDQTFDGNYAYVGTGIATGYESFVNEDNIFTLEDMPTTLLTSPWTE